MSTKNIIEKIIDEEFPNAGMIKRMVERWALKTAYKSGFDDGKEGNPNSNITRPVRTTEGFQMLYDKGYEDGQNTRKIF